MPQSVNPESTLLVYLHGRIVEGDGPIPAHPRWGQYQFESVVNALASTGHALVAERRAANTDPVAYAAQLASTLRGYLEAGLPAERIVLIGFSRGAAIAILTAHELQIDGLTTILLAGCASWLETSPEIQARGHLRSIYERSDRVGSCESFRARSPGVASWQELALDTGLEHGAFYRPIDEWVAPVHAWAERASGSLPPRET